jgi:hypothetical protein
MRPNAILATVVMVVAVACGGGGGGSDGGPGPDDDDDDDDDDSAGDGGPGGTVRERARALAEHLRGDGHFMIGLGNDNQGPYDHEVPIDLHYVYLVGYGDNNGWPVWNEGGAYVDYFAANADDHGVTPMFTYYQLALELEQGNAAVFTDEGRMRQYLLDQRLMFERIAATGAPAVVHMEPDFFGYLQQQVAGSGVAPDAMPARLRFDDVHDCDALPETVAGLTRCVIAMARAIAPQARVGFHASQWGAWYDVTDPDADVEGSGRATGDFLASLGDADFVTVETLDRDAGFWETSGGGPECSVTGGSRGAVYWDETNATVPSFEQHLRWVGALTERMGRPAIWWQTPLGVPSETCGGSDGAWRDNRVHYFFTHVEELAAAGGAGAAFGTGAGGQTTLDSDGDQLKDFAVAYAAAPLEL